MILDILPALKGEDVMPPHRRGGGSVARTASCGDHPRYVSATVPGRRGSSPPAVRPDVAVRAARKEITATMPHSDNLAQLSVNPETGAPALETKLTMGIFAHATTNEKPADIEFDTGYSCGSPIEVADTFGEGSDAHNAAQAGRALGATNYEVVLAERTSQTETLSGTNDTPSTAGVASTAPMTGLGGGVNEAGDPVVVTVDGGDPITATPVTSSPPKPLGEEDTADATPAAGAAVANADTAEIATGDETAGDGTGGGISVEYETISYTLALQALAAASVDILAVAGGRFDRATIGDLDELTTWCDSYDVTMPLPFVRGTTLDGGAGPASVYAEQQLVQDVGSYSPSKYAFPLANSSTDDLGGALAGLFSVNDPEFDPFQEAVDLNAGPSNRYTPGNIGVPERAGTFEGGEDGAGPANVLFSDGATKISNCLTTAGIDSPYRYIDIARAEAHIKALAGTAVSAVQGNDDFRFDEKGESMLRDALDDVFRELRGRSAYNFIIYDIPSASDLSRDMRANRFWDGIVITVGFAPTVHRVGMTVEMTLATENPNLAGADEDTTTITRTTTVSA